MLVLSRKKQQFVVIDCPDGFEHQLKVTVLEVRGGRVKLGFDVEDDVPVPRLKVLEQSHASGPKKSPTTPKVETDRWEDDGGGRPDQCTTVPIFHKVSLKESLRDLGRRERVVTRQLFERGKS